MSVSLAPKMAAVALAIGATFLVASVPASADVKIGVAGAVANEVTATIGTSSQPLNIGHDLFTDELISTGQRGTAQLLFLDETSISIGPQSDVKLDRFVYDPQRQAGSVVFETSRGVLRFISGSQQPGTYQLKTPVATIGFRGTIGETGSYNGYTYALCEEGELTVRLNDGSTVILGPGDVVIVKPDGTHQVAKWENYVVAASGAGFPLLGKKFVDDYIDLGAEPNLNQDLNDTLDGGFPEPEEECKYEPCYGDVLIGE
jgi:hypothetical protein